MITYALFTLGTILSLVFLYIFGLFFITALTARSAEKLLPPLGKFMDVSGGRIHYVDSGKGIPILMIHGLSGQMRNFTYALQERLNNDFRTIIIDRPGSGYSKRQADDTARVTEQAKLIAEFIAKLDLDRPLIVGHSLGGAVSLALALNHPEHVGGLALISPLTHPLKTTGTAPVFNAISVIQSPFLRKLYSWTFATPYAFRHAKKMLANIFHPEDVPKDSATKGGGLLSLRPRAHYAASVDFLASEIDLPEMSERYHNIDVPFGIIYGSQDQILNYETQGVAMKNKVTALDLETVEGGGHMILMTQPDRVSAFVRRVASRVNSKETDRQLPNDTGR